MRVIENKSTYNIEEILTITERDGNKKRPYLLLNKLQAKYLPVDPQVTFEMFDELFHQINVNMRNRNILVVGFAETATAIGARVAEDIEKIYHASVTYLPTTREIYKQVPMVEFEEVHSHAVEQILYGDKELFENADYIVFVEDEVTTGNTILNCVEKLNLKCDYIVASILNCMSEEELERFQKHNITPYWLIKTDKSGFEDIGENNHENTPYSVHFLTFPPESFFHKISNPRLGVDIKKYRIECEEISELISDVKDNTLVLGTEECMYPAIKVAEQLKKKSGKKIFVSATTRVPACTNENPNYPLHDRRIIQSCYGERSTYIYNLKAYNEVILITDGKWNQDLISALLSVGNHNIKIIEI